MATPDVNVLAEIREICMDFTNPLEIFREAIQNSYDANAKRIWIAVEEQEIEGRKRINITIEDDGDGIYKDKIHCFFDLGHSTKSDPKTGKKLSDTVGYKGHGTKIFYNSEGIILDTWYDSKYVTVEMNNPRAKLFSGEIPEYTDPTEVSKEDKNYLPKAHGEHGTRITIIGYQPNVTNPTAHLSHVTIKDHILWFTRHGSVEPILYGPEQYKNKILFLKSFDTDRIKPALKTGYEDYDNGYERIVYGHVFPNEYYKDKDLTKLQADLKEQTGKEFKKADLISKNVHISKDETAMNMPNIPFQMIFFIEGDETKRLYNKMLKPRGRQRKDHDDQYTVESRYGLWACKDFVPIVNVTRWIETRGIKTRFHGFVNCNEFELTANRSSIDNTPSDILDRIKERVKEIYDEGIRQSKEYKTIVLVIEEEEKQRQLHEDEKEFKKRLKKIDKLKKCIYKNVILFEPRNEVEVYGLLVTLMTLEPNLFDFDIIDYRTDKGIDFLTKKKMDPIETADFKYVELKHILKGSFNHAFKFLYKVICYRLEKGLGKVIGVDDIRILQTKDTQDGSKFYLVPEEPSPIKDKIEVIVLEKFLLDKLGIKFA